MSLIDEYNNNSPEGPVGCEEWIHDLATNQMKKITAKDVEALRINVDSSSQNASLDIESINLPDEEELMTSIENICINDSINHLDYMRVNDLLVKNMAQNEQLQMENTALKCDYENLLKTFELTHNKQVIDSNLKDVITDKYKGCNYIDPVDSQKPSFAEHIAASMDSTLDTMINQQIEKHLVGFDAEAEINKILSPETVPQPEIERKEPIQLTTQIKCDPLYIDINKVIAQMAVIMRLIPMKVQKRNRTQFEYLDQLINQLRSAMYPTGVTSQSLSSDNIVT